MNVTHKTIPDKKMNQERTPRKGSNPLAQTARGKLQNQRQKLNEKINKELRMRTGAENLYRAAENNKKLRDRVGLELSYFNSNIQLLKEQLSEMNSSVEVYQHENCGNNTPMIPLGLKETTQLDFSSALKDEILEHYSEDGEKYNPEMKELFDLREAVRTPERSHAGVELLVEYFNQLNYLEKRFFSGKRRLPVYFQWYDCLTGVPDMQKSIGFEKGSILYNIGALYTQIACKQDRTKSEDVVQSIVNFEKSAGAFMYLQDHFSAAPSEDMKHETLAMFVSLMLAQAQECVLERRLTGQSKEGVLNCVQIAQEAALVSQKYRDCHTKMSTETMRSYLPFSWLTVAESKHHFFKGLAHYYVALAMLEQKEATDVATLRETFESLHVLASDENNGLTLPRTEEERKHFGKAHLQESVLNHEESMRIHDLCRQMRKIDTFRDILQKTHERSLNRFSLLEEEDDFSELLTVTEITASSEHDTSAMKPEFSKVKISDIFRKLGPIKVFRASLEWSAPRLVILERQPNEGFGFSVRGDAPVAIIDIEDNSIAMKSGMKVNDYIVGIGSVDTKWAKHDDVVQLVRQANMTLKLVLVTPALLPEPAPDTPSSTRSPTDSQTKSHNHNEVTERERKNQNRISTPWTFLRRNSSKSKDPTQPRPLSMSSPLMNGNTKPAINGSIKTSYMNGGDVEL